MRYLLLLMLLMPFLLTFAQNKEIDSLQARLTAAVTDTARVNRLNDLLSVWVQNNLDTTIDYAARAIALAQRVHYVAGEANARRIVAFAYSQKGNYTQARSFIAEAERLYRSIHDTIGLAKTYGSYGLMYGLQSKYDSSILYFKKNLSYTERLPDKSLANKTYQNIAISYQMQSDYANALFYQTKALRNAEAAQDINALAYLKLNIALIYQNLGDTVKVEQLEKEAIAHARKAGIRNVELYANANLSSLYLDKKQYRQAYGYAMKAADLGRLVGDEAITASCLSRGARALAYLGNYARAEQLNAQAVAIADSSGQPLNLFQTLSDKGFIFKLQKQYPAAIAAYEKSFAILKDADIYATEVGAAYYDASECYEAVRNFEKALAAAKLSAQIRDSVRSSENVRKTTELSLRYDFDKQQQMAQAQQEKRDAVAQAKQSALILGLLLTLAVIAVVVYGYLNKQKTNKQLTVQKAKLQKTLTELQSAQAQLVQSEKMASLGELTAGIAHEIQNPLNFVNNFSEVSTELLAEMETELESGSKEEALFLSHEVKKNLGKIVHHGKRADSIVKGMLLHSRKSSGQKEPTQLNVLAEEYLRLSYFGLRAKDNRFQATLETDFDTSLSAVNLIPQDMGRVLLNLFNNAFYAVQQRKENSEKEYVPKVSVSTRRLGNKVQISVKDNGTGIPDGMADKIFQPFYTTKPTGHGTGLGLSLSYEIITAQHGGTLQVHSEEGKGSEFVILLPYGANA